MSFKCGVIGLPNAGKTTLFNALTGLEAQAACYPFCTIEPNIGRVFVPDPRLQVVAQIAGAQKITQTYIEFVDVAGLVKGASRGEGLGNRFLGNIREVDALIHVLRHPRDPGSVGTEVTGNCREDLAIIQYELVMADLETVNNRREKTMKMVKTGERHYKEELSFLDKLEAHLNQGGMARDLMGEDEGSFFLQELFLLTAKPVLYVFNMHEDISVQERQVLREELMHALGDESAEILTLCARLQAELNDFTLEERREFLEGLEWSDTGVEELIIASYRLLNLITFFTAKGKETRAWTLPKGTRAVTAAGKIHTDMERGFIRAEVIPFETLKQESSFVKARDKGLIRLEGKEYLVQDGDVIQFRFNV
ncbi:redox-regulated ATPase YchF [Candidatus Contubernalis alkaliaceticus]|uniref:redox-regulated ATPase YchF n=1 Tax=Candidatus Contubernalis alkaliaceticus TaxID=338645 RepID=UPI001F4C5064|nr:redox-regulated ATPase YchF [Candidatus Contubernalis alkalaceticus]UNC93714.1 redox-regulated ATPase YchF [Candidatus Contubernalis alkalaceticus]